MITLLHNTIHRALSAGRVSLSLVWCPGHKGIPPNEVVDSLARNGPYLARTLNWVAPDDLAALIRRDWLVEKKYSWMNSNYCSSFPHLGEEDDAFRRWNSHRREDMWISR